ncbi:glycerol-3-phosphate 1-O-acyltransferase PlsY [Brevundimonas sp. 2R-24]|uniref:Glycerol-3-phosphate acyltransferase n=1 Tax=Peiella sedimenti TaxID=3061083 RepID=A0ABT8SPP1_9CAUL|nr:glycerol-3-phosphate 1-O-acyltransferase PlsY [Caulobacteraceae bacterium XZ-24]
MAYENPALWTGIVAAVSYLIGAIPFGVMITKAAGLGDVRKIGSGNIGATNVLRTGRKDLALATLILDGGKGAFAVLATMLIFSDLGFRTQLAAVAGAAAFVGHLFPVWLGFKGGKGVATFFGVLLAMAWPVGVAAGAVWILMAVLMRYSSLSALTAAAAAPLIAWAMGTPWAAPPLVSDWRPVAMLAAFMAVLIYIRHAANIGRLLKGEEPRIGANKG